MTNVHSHQRICSLASAVVLPVLMFVGAGVVTVPLLPQVATAQRETGTRTTGERTTLNVRRSGEPDGVNWPDINIPAPSSPTLAQLSQLAPVGVVLSTLQGPWKVTAGDMVAPGSRIRLAFTEAVVVSGSFAGIHGRPAMTVGQPTGAALLRIRAVASGERYFIACTVGPASGSYRVSGPGSSATFTGDGHVLATYEAADTNWALFKIERMDSADTWAFISCDVSRVQ